MTVKAGLHSYSQEAAGQQTRRVVAIEYHENYKNLVNDIAILKLDSPVEFSDTIRPVCLAREGEGAPTTRTCVGTGWGRNESMTHFLLSSNGPTSLRFCR